MTLIHGSKLLRKAAEDAGLQSVVTAYTAWREQSEAITGRKRADIRALTKLLEAYKSFAEPILDARQNSAQEVLQSSIIEEFFQHVFRFVERDVVAGLQTGPAAGFIDLVFNPKDVKSLVTAPEFTIRRKDHDFVIGATVQLTVKAIGKEESKSESIVVPAVAIECKRYLERNMLDECAGTAEKVKRATPYCLFFVVAEFLKMDDAAPEVSLIDEIFILRKQRNSERLAEGFRPNPIDADLVWEIYDGSIRHLRKVWWNPQSALTTGKAFGRPQFP